MHVCMGEGREEEGCKVHVHVCTCMHMHGDSHEVCAGGVPVSLIDGPHLQALPPQGGSERVLESAQHKHDSLHQPGEGKRDTVIPPTPLRTSCGSS